MYIFETLRKGSQGDDVRALQMALPAWAWERPVAYTDIDGKYGDMTHKAIFNYQKEIGLTADGIAGEKTLASLGLWTDTMIGIDVSDHQGVIDWSKVKASGQVQFAIIKASQGGSFKAKRWAKNYDNATKQGLIVGAYHFADGKESPAIEAANFLNTLGERKLGLPPVLDVETGFPLKNQKGVDWVIEWLEIVEQKLGVKPMLYTNSNFVKKTFGDSGKPLGNYKIWFAKWGSQPLKGSTPPWDRWSIWQYSNKGSVSGISGNVDMNRLIVKEFQL